MAQATVDLGLNTAAFTAGLNEAGQKAQTFEGRIAGLFRRSPLHRAERAFADFAANLATGNVAGAVQGLAGRFTGLGLVIGTVVGAGALIFNKLKGQLDATAKAAAAVNTELAKPLALQSNLGVEGITAQIAMLDKALTDLAVKRKSLATRIQEAGVRGAPETFDERAFFRGQPQPGAVRRTEEETAQERGQKRIHALRLADVEAETALVNIHALSTQFSEKEAALEKNRVDAAQKRAALQLKFGSDPREAANLHKELLNISRDEKLTADEIERKAALKEKELGIDKDIAAQALLGINADDQKISKLEQQLALIQSQLGGAQSLTTENRKQLELAQIKTKAELDAALKARGPVERPAIGIGGATPQGIYDPNTGEFRNVLRPQEQANLRSSQAAAEAALRGDQAQYENDMRGWQARYEDYLRGGEYMPEQLKRPQPPAGYDVNPVTGELIKRPQTGDKTQLTKDEFQSAMDAVMQKYWGN